MTAIRKKNETTVVDLIGDDLLSWVRKLCVAFLLFLKAWLFTWNVDGCVSCLQFSGAEEEKIKRAVGTFCSNQPFALELIKSRQKKDQRFASFVQVRLTKFLSWMFIYLVIFSKFQNFTNPVCGLKLIFVFLCYRRQRVIVSVEGSNWRTWFPWKCRDSPNTRFYSKTSPNIPVANPSLFLIIPLIPLTLHHTC